MASVHKVKTKGGETRYRVRWRDPSGRPAEKWVKKKAQADRLAIEVEHRKLAGTYIDPDGGRERFETYAKIWHQSRTKLRDTTRSQQESLFRSRVFPAFGNMELGKIKKLDVQRFVASLNDEGLSGSTIRQCWLLVNGVLEDAVDNDMIGKNPARKAELPDEASHEEKTIIGPEEVEALANAIPPHLSAMVRFVGYTGLRFGEAAGLETDRVFVEVPGVEVVTLDVAVDRYGVDGLREFEGYVEVTKALKEVNGRVRDEDGRLRLGKPKTDATIRDFPLDPDLVMLLAEHYAHYGDGEEGLLFRSTAGTPLLRSNFRRTWTRSVKKVLGEDVKLKFHWLRDSYKNQLREAGVTLETQTELMGHAPGSRVTARHYGSRNQRLTREATRSVRYRRSGGADVGLEAKEEVKAQVTAS